MSFSFSAYASPAVDEIIPGYTVVPAYAIRKTKNEALRIARLRCHTYSDTGFSPGRAVGVDLCSSNGGPFICAVTCLRPIR